MIDLDKRHEDIMKLIERLDLSPTMYKNASEKYQAIAQFLSDCGIDADFYPQGSFAFGTVVRPSVKDPDAAYDLDFICQVKGTKDDISPSELRRVVQSALENSDRYGGKLEIWAECFTVEYADVNGVSFKIDIVPATDDDPLHKESLRRKSIRPDLMNTAIVIPKENGEHNYRWLTNNPKGFKEWFDEINRPYMEYEKNKRTAASPSGNIHYASVEQIPVTMEKTSVQRVIQIMKYHRDNYYLKIPDGDDIKPISAIINTLVATIAKHAASYSDTFELLSYVLDELRIYSFYLKMPASEFHKRYENNNIIQRDDNGRWIIPNPADPEDNLADQWNMNPKAAQQFFRWIDICREDMFTAMGKQDAEFRTAMENAFGINAIQNAWGDKYKLIRRSEPQPIMIKSKPYRKGR